MRSVLPGDISYLARHLILKSEYTWVAIITGVLDEADYAHTYRETYGTSHPKYGSGSIAAACSGMDKASEPTFSDSQYRRAWMTILNELELRDTIKQEERW